MILFNPYTHNSFIWMMLKVFMFSNFCWYLNNLTSVSCQHKRLSQLIPQFCRACIIWSYFWHGEYNSRRYILIYTTLSIVVEVTNHIWNGNKTTSNIPTQTLLNPTYFWPTWILKQKSVFLTVTQVGAVELSEVHHRKYFPSLNHWIHILVYQNPCLVLRPEIFIKTRFLQISYLDNNHINCQVWRVSQSD